jgi:hypothetical protein
MAGYGVRRASGGWAPLAPRLACISGALPHRGGAAAVAYPLIRLACTGPLTIREFAESLDCSQPGISQTVTAMRKEDLVTSEPGLDARTRQVSLTEPGRGWCRCWSPSGAPLIARRAGRSSAVVVVDHLVPAGSDESTHHGQSGVENWHMGDSDMYGPAISAQGA